MQKYFLGNPVPPKTLNEAAQFSVCFSAAWDSKVKFSIIVSSIQVGRQLIMLEVFMMMERFKPIIGLVKLNQ